jgi:protein tyrosine kinase modulator
MATAAITPRDQLDRLLRLVRRALRYWWMIALIGFAGGSAATAFAFMRKPRFLSESVVLYRELIPLSALQGSGGGRDLRDLGGRVREMLLARPRLEQAINELGLYPDLVEKDRMVDAVDLMRRSIVFRSRGTGTFYIGYFADSKEKARDVTARLADMLIEDDNRMRTEQVNVTSNFLKAEKTRAEDELRVKEKAQAEFLAKHPEFVQESSGQSSTGSAVRAAQKNESRTHATDPKILALERQRDRIKARLKAPDQPPPVRTPAQPSAERVAALARVDNARRAVEAARDELAHNQARFTDQHPDVVAAKRRLQDAERRLREAEAAVPAQEINEPIAVATDPAERQALKDELDRIERDIADQKRRGHDDKPDGSGGDDEDTGANWVVALETDWQRLSREVAEARERNETLEARLFSAQIAAASELSGQSAQMEIVDPAYLPSRPSGAPKRLIVMAGVVVAFSFAGALALLLALVDDRLYDRQDVERLELAPVLVVVPGVKKKRRRVRG